MYQQPVTSSTNSHSVQQPWYQSKTVAYGAIGGGALVLILGILALTGALYPDSFLAPLGQTFGTIGYASTIAAGGLVFIIGLALLYRASRRSRQNNPPNYHGAPTTGRQGGYYGPTPPAPQQSGQGGVYPPQGYDQSATQDNYGMYAGGNPQHPPTQPTRSPATQFVGGLGGLHQVMRPPVPPQHSTTPTQTGSPQVYFNPGGVSTLQGYPPPTRPVTLTN